MIWIFHCLFDIFFFRSQEEIENKDIAFYASLNSDFECWEPSRGEDERKEISIPFLS